MEGLMAEENGRSDEGGRRQHKLRKKGGVAEAGEAPVRVYHRHRKCITCCGVAVSLIVAVVVVIVILVFTVFKQRDPTITLDRVSLDALSFSFVWPTFQPRENITLGLTVSVKNPNKASFKFGASSAYLFYRDTLVGVVPIKAGTMKADSTLTTSSSATILLDRFLSNSNLTPDLASGELPFVANASVSGKVKILNIIKKHVESSSLCTVLVFVSNSSTGDIHCEFKTKL